MNILEKLGKFLDSSNSPVLFAGAGVSVRAGLPTWPSYIDHIAQGVRKFDQLTSDIMTQRLKEGDLITAADHYFLCKKIPENRMFELLTEPLKGYNSHNIVSLVNLPFQTIVTTNYDRCLLDAYAAVYRESPREVNLGDPTLRSASFEERPYIARIHGRVEVPQSMVVSGAQFSELQRNRDYHSFLNHIFTRMQVLFVGYSFLDPAIENVLDSIRKNIGSCHKGTHVAMVPQENSNELVSKLASFNIETVTYSSYKQHAELWNTFYSLTSEQEKQRKTRELEHDPFERARRYLATTFARNRLGATRRPLRKAIVEGIVADILKRNSTSQLSLEDVIDQLHNEIHLKREMIHNLVKEALERLVEDKLCSKHTGSSTTYQWTDSEDTYFDDAILELVDGAMNRYVVRYGGRDTDIVRCCIDATIRNALLYRGWDLGGCFASGRVPDGIDFRKILDATVDCSGIGATTEARHVSEAIRDLFRNPNSRQSLLLSELGRLSFGVELALETPQDALLHEHTLPERIYFDTNVVLPAIVPYHPLHDIYNRALTLLLQAAAESMINVEIMISRDFVEEIIGHRNIAIREYEIMSPNVREELKKDVALYGSRNINVYLSGYINCIINKSDVGMDFMEFMKLHAPYRNINELRSWLEERGMRVVEKNWLIGTGKDYANILYALEIALADAITRRMRTAEIVAHDAVQLAGLSRDYKMRRRSIFVTADRQLREFVSVSKFAHLGNAMFSNVGLVQLVDLLVGKISEYRGVTNLLFSPKISSKSEQVRNYLIDRALESYDQAMAMEIPHLVDKCTEDILGGKDIDLNWESSSPEERAKVRKYIDGFEDEYYKGMRESIERREMQLR